MVSLENRSLYLQSIAGNSVLTAFSNLLSHQQIHSPQDLNEIDKIYYGIIEAISTDSVNVFDIHYQAISRRTPTRDSISPFVHNDYLIFSIIVGVIKFSYDKNWIEKIIDIRTRNNTTITFENIIKENYYSKSNIAAVIISFLNLTKKTAVSKPLQDEAYMEITKESAIFEQGNDFIALCFINAYNSIILSREIVDTDHYDALLEFETKFAKRTNIIAGILYNLLLLFLIYGIYKTLNLFPQIKQSFSDAIGIIGLIGLTISNFITGIKPAFEKIIQKILGYSSTDKP
ncbi:hypothetical protein HDE68_004854 [Pedobacter cryoconitis]|uniref:Uncharacterized protein n=1 Tax=Pedobacter cryoconitis TaxID=188932 RepID=A0A7W9E1A6_9SPHI|nr:hypothetical protein [Pedobacter cryoconitis]MBB5638916.1 hypothetical protein [Pedobacter cryoconitis]